MVSITPVEVIDLSQDYGLVIMAQRTGYISEDVAQSQLSELERKGEELAKKYKRGLGKGLVIAAAGIGLIVADTFLATETKSIAQYSAEMMDSIDSAQLIEQGLRVAHYVMIPVRYALIFGGGAYSMNRSYLIGRVTNLEDYANKAIDTLPLASRSDPRRN